MSKRRPLVLKSKDWKRLQDAAGSVELNEPLLPQGVSREYVQEMIELSQEYMKNWPDSIQGYKAVLDIAIENKRQKDEELRRVYREKMRNKPSNAEIIKEAKKGIFNTTNYGKQLLSALTEAKVWDEREAQIKFKKILKAKAKAKEKEQELMNTLEVGQDPDEVVKISRHFNKEFAAWNKEFHESNLKKRAEEAKEEIQIQLQEARQQQLLLKAEEKLKDACDDWEGVKLNEAQQREAKERKAEREKVEAALDAVFNHYQDRIACRRKRVMNEIFKDRTLTDSFNKHYKLIENINSDLEKKYQDFIDIGIKKLEIRTEKVKNREARRQLQKDKKRAQEDECLRIFDEVEKEAKPTPQSYADRQSFMFNAHRPRKPKPVPEIVRDCKFLKPSTALSASLAARTVSPSPWSGLQGSHAYFATAAGEALAECRPKKLVRNVVDEYRKANRLDSTTLPVDNYY